MAPIDLQEDVIDDLLYFARTADISELQATINQASDELNSSPCDILVAAKDGDTGNTAMHMAAANGHTGLPNLSLQ